MKLKNTYNKTFIWQNNHTAIFYGEISLQRNFLWLNFLTGEISSRRHFVTAKFPNGKLS